jgi:hypothetical protein
MMACAATGIACRAARLEALFVQALGFGQVAFRLGAITEHVECESMST